MEESDKIIDDYLLGKLKGDSLRNFERQLKMDQDLAAQVNNRKAILGLVDAMGDLKMMEQIKQVHQQEMSKQTKPNLSKKVWPLLAAAAIIITFGFCIWLFLKPAPTNNIVDDYYKPHELSFTSRNELNDEQLAKADLAYKSGDFRKALPIFQAIYDQDTSRSKVGLAIGLCHIELGNYNQALQYFDQLSSKEFDLYKNHALWYSALIKLRQDNVTAAKAYLQKLLEQPSSDFQQQAAALLSEI